LLYEKSAVQKMNLLFTGGRKFHRFRCSFIVGL